MAERNGLLNHKILTRVLRAEYAPEVLYEENGQVCFSYYPANGGLSIGIAFQIATETFVLGSTKYFQPIERFVPLSRWQHLKRALLG